MKHRFAAAALAVSLLVLSGCMGTSLSAGQDRTGECRRSAGAAPELRCDREKATADRHRKRERSTDREVRKQCVDVTSYDQNWDNDMLCSRPNGTKFYTDYAGARAFLGH